LVQNRGGKFVAPAAKTFQAAASGATWNAAQNFDQLLVDAPGEESYPIVLTVFAQMKKGTRSRGGGAALNFFLWSLERGGRQAEELGYVPLPPALVGEIKKYWASTFKFSS
jgi:phosphate transport system substrate-binding protein